MSSLADLPEVVGFFSYSRDDDESYKGRLSGLREAIQHELAAQLGRAKASFRLWQDREAIAPGKLWEEEIKTAVGHSVFFIPIVTPRAVNSDYCKFEFDAFLARERELGRADLVFPILYVPVPALANEAQWRNHPVLSVIGRRQYVDWQAFRYADAPTPAMREEIARFANKIVEALNLQSLTPDERRQQEAQERAQVQARAEEGRRRLEAEAAQRAQDEARRRKEEVDRRARETVKAQERDLPARPEPEPQSPGAAGSEPRLAPFSVTAPAIYIGTALLTWWLTAASIGPAAFQDIAWLTNTTWGVAVLGCYFLAGIVQAVATMRVMTRLTSKVRYEGVVAIAALLLTILLGLVMASLSGNHAAVVQFVGSTLGAILVLLFLLSAAAQIVFGMNHVIEAALQGAPARHLARIVNVLCAAATVAVAGIAVVKLLSY
jgi:succinate dehydrogenase hydrophobic anchor subunit